MSDASVSCRSGLELLTVGRVGADLYPLQNGPLKDVRTFEKFLGGTATNVAVGAARLGRSTAMLTKVGPDGFGDYVREALAGFGVDPSYVGTAQELQTNRAAEGFNNMLADSRGPGADGSVHVDFAPHARSLGCHVEEVPDGDAVALRTAHEAARKAAKASGRPAVVFEHTHSSAWTEAGAWWETGVPASLSGRASYEDAKAAAGSVALMRHGVVGYGAGGRFFHTPFIDAADGVELAGVVTRSPARAAQVRHDWPGVPVFGSPEDLLASGVDAERSPLRRRPIVTLRYRLSTPAFMSWSTSRSCPQRQSHEKWLRPGGRATCWSRSSRTARGTPTSGPLPPSSRADASGSRGGSSPDSIKTTPLRSAWDQATVCCWTWAPTLSTR